MTYSDLALTPRNLPMTHNDPESDLPFCPCRPPHIDPPSGSAPPLPWGETDQLPECPTRSGESKRLLVNQGADDKLGQQSEAGRPARLSAPIREEDQRTICVEGMPTSYGKAQSPPPQTQASPTVHRKVHRKTNRRKSSESSPSVPGGRWPETQQEVLFSSDNPDPLVTPYPVGQTMEEVRPFESFLLLWFGSMTFEFQCLLLVLLSGDTEVLPRVQFKPLPARGVQATSTQPPHLYGDSER